MKVLKLEETYLNLKKVRSFRIEPDGDVLVIYRKKEAYRFTGNKAELLKKWLLNNHQDP